MCDSAVLFYHPEIHVARGKFPSVIPAIFKPESTGGGVRHLTALMDAG